MKPLTSRSIAGWLVALALSAAVPALAFNPQPEPPGSTAFGIVESQIAEIDLVNLTHETAGLAPTTCAFRVRIHDASGETLWSQERVVRPGEIGSVEYRPGLRAGERRLLRVSVDLLGDLGRRMACNGGTRGSVQLIHERAGWTQLVLPLVTDFLPPASDD